MSNVSRRRVLQCCGALPFAPVLRVLDPFVTAQGEEPKPAKPDPYRDAQFVDGPPPLPAAGSFTVAVLPDTQFYSLKYPQNFFAQTDWIVAQTESRRIAAVLHLGDITNNSTPAEWEVASQAMARLDGHVPYFMVVGNHDYGPEERIGRASPCNEAFPLSRFRKQSQFGGAYDKRARPHGEHLSPLHRRGPQVSGARARIRPTQ